MIGNGGLREKRETTEMTEKEKTGRGKTYEEKEMMRIGEMIETGEKTEREKRIGTNGMTGPRGMKESDGMSGKGGRRRTEETSRSLSALWMTRGP